jgi:hypothetical protein
MKVKFMKYIFLLSFVIGCNAPVDVSKNQITSAAPSAKSVPEKTESEKEKDALKNQLDRASKAANYAQAFKECDGLFSNETFNAPNVGGICFKLWATKNLVVNDAAVAKNETTYGLIMKNPALQISKKMCLVGNIIQIEEENMLQNTVSNGLMHQGYGGNLVHFYNIGSSGNLVEGKPARMCGFVIGQYHYHNSGGGTGHAIDLVGAWDLNFHPEY